MKAIIAARLSALAKDGGLSIDTQDEKSRGYAEHEGIEIVDTVPDVKSGTVPPWRRKRLRKWVDPEGSLIGTYDMILAAKMDRLSRGDQQDFNEIESWARENGKILQIVDGPRWPARDAGDDFMWTAYRRAARDEWESIRERNLRSQAAILGDGGIVGKPPTGYRTQGPKYGKKLVESADSKLIRRIFDLAHTDRLTLLEIEQATGRDSATIGKILNNRTYSDGIWVVNHQGATYEFEVPKLIDAHVQDAVIEMLTARRKNKSGNPGVKSVVHSVLWCGACLESPLWKSGEEGMFFRCSGRKGHPRCGAPLVPRHAVLNAVESLMSGNQRKVRRIEVVSASSVRTERRKIERQIRGLDPLADDYIERVTELRARLVGLPAEENTTRIVEEDFTYADQWQGKTDAQKNSFLRSRDVKVYAARHDVATLPAVKKDGAWPKGWEGWWCWIDGPGLDSPLEGTSPAPFYGMDITPL